MAISVFMCCLSAKAGWLIIKSPPYCEEELNRRKRPRRYVTGAHREERQLASTLNECWSMDFVSDNLFNGKRIRALTIVDNFSRECLAIHVGEAIRGEEVAGVLESLRVLENKKPKSIRIDNGPEFISKILDKWAYVNHVTLDFSRPGKTNR